MAPLGNLIAINTVLGTYEIIGLTGVPTDRAFASMWAEGSGLVYGAERNIAGEVYEFDTRTGVATLLGETVVSGSQDGFFCHDNAGPFAKNVPTLSEWGLIAMAGILGIVGFMVMRRKKVTA